ncbi:uncharacterized protein LOC124537584 [Vanessa cardui]|uniref:uncharacterized protein LOC124537584 n=1 Tax=Vanessa cardui TaxID=171605 RepID=UPI001F135D99|nr:uncharacterized protein LOC124537584 [Vanessa cardui]
MAKKKLDLFINIDNEKEFEYMLAHNLDRLICAELHSSFAGPCTALDHLFVKIKLDWGDGKVVLLRVCVDEIQSLSRFQCQSEPVFLFILNNKITKVFRGVNNILFAEVAKKEIEYYNEGREGAVIERPCYDIGEASPEEQEWLKIRLLERHEEEMLAATQRNQRQAARKRHRAELMVPHLKHINFVLYWPHAKHAHPELYERWDINNIMMVGREEILLTKEIAEDVLYAGDAPLNEASLHMLLSGPALAICFRLLDEDKHFVSLVRRILYEELAPLDESKSLNEQFPRKTAFDLYKTFSPAKEDVLRKRHEDKLKRKEEALEKRARRLSEMQRLARQAIEDAIQAKRAQREQQKLQLLKSGNLSALEKLRQEPFDERVDIVVPELPEEEESSEEENSDEYFPPAGLLIPGFYAPPNDIAKANGLAILFPTLVSENVTPEPEHLPPHVLVMIDMAKRYKAIEAMANYKKEIIHMGIFKATSPTDAVHIAYSVKQFDSKQRCHDLESFKLAFMVSVKSDLALLELTDLIPFHVSRDPIVGEIECALLFSVDYSDHYNEFEDFDIINKYIKKYL